jgi:hypothetical protein
MQRVREQAAKRRRGWQQMRPGTSGDGCRKWCQPVNELCKRGDIAQNNGAYYIHAGIDVARTVQRIETDNIGSIQMAGGQNKLFLFLAVDSSNLNKMLVDVTRPSSIDGDAPRHNS